MTPLTVLKHRKLVTTTAVAGFPLFHLATARAAAEPMVSLVQRGIDRLSCSAPFSE